MPKLVSYHSISELLNFADSYYSGDESDGNGKWSGGCTNGWKGPKIRRSPISIYSGNYFLNSHDKMDITSIIVNLILNLC